MEVNSNTLKIDSNHKIKFSGNIFDHHGSYSFNAYIDTGCTFNLVLNRELADAVCAEVVCEVLDISIGGGLENKRGFIRKANLKFGPLTLRDYEFLVVDDNKRNLIGIKFFQDSKMLLVMDFASGKTDGCFITTNQDIARAMGKTVHFCLAHHMNPLNGMCHARYVVIHPLMKFKNLSNKI